MHINKNHNMGLRWAHVKVDWDEPCSNVDHARLGLWANFLGTRFDS